MDKNLQELGNRIRTYRAQKNIPLRELAKKLNVSTAYLSNLENGKVRPPTKIVSEIATILSVPEPQQLEALLHNLDLAGHKLQEKKEDNKESSSFDPSRKQISHEGPTGMGELRIDVPENISILYSDSIYITSSAYGLVFDIAQQLGSTPVHRVVTRFGISAAHARSLQKLLGKKILEVEKMQDEDTKRRSEKNE